MNKGEFLEQYFGLIPYLHPNSRSKMSQIPNDTDGRVMTRSLYQSLSEPLLSKKRSEKLFSSQSASSLDSHHNIQSVEIVLEKMFKNSETDDCDLLLLSERSANSGKNNNTLDDLIKDLDSSFENTNAFHSNDPENKTQKKMLNDSQLQWGNTYPVMRPCKVICDTINTADLSDSSEKNSQSQEISTTHQNDSSPERDTQMVWEDIFKKFVNNRTQNKKKLEQEKCIDNVHESPSQEKSTNPTENEDMSHVSNHKYSVVENSTNPTENKDISHVSNHKDSAVETVFSDDELLHYLCYHSFELVDFTRDEIWYQLGLNKNINKESCLNYKQRFLNHIVKCADSYHVPSYFSSYLHKKYNKDKPLSTPNKLNSIVQNSDCSPEKVCNHSRRDSELEKTAINGEDINTDQLFCSCKIKCSDSAEKSRRKSKGSDLVKNRFFNRNRSHVEHEETHGNKKRRVTSPCMLSESEDSDDNNDDCNPFKNCTSMSLRRRRPTLRDKPNAKNSQEKSNLTQSDKSVADSSHLQLQTIPRSDSFSTDTDHLTSSDETNPKQSKSKRSDSSYSFLPTPSTSKARLKSSYSQAKVMYQYHEKEKILQYLQTKKADLDTIKGNVFWKNMEASGVIPDRTWQSLKNHFFRYLLNDLWRYSLPPNFEAKLKHYSGRVSNK